MADQSPSLPRPSPEQRQAAAGQFERANQVITTGNYDYGIQLLMNCCLLDPANFLYRQTLRQTVKRYYKNNLRGSRFAVVTTFTTKIRLRKALKAENHLKVLEYGEQVLVRNPWDIGTQLAMAEAFDALGLLDLAIWTLDQARQKDAKHARLNRALARLFEKRGNFTQAGVLWELVRKVDPKDLEAQGKMKDLAASATIARGRYEEMIHAADTEESAAAGRPDATAEHPRDAATVDPAAGPPTAERHAKEITALEARIQADPTNPNPYLHLASLFRRTDQLDKALAVLQKGLGATGNSFELASEIADLHIETFRRNLAITEGKLRGRPEDQKLQKIRAQLLKEINTRELHLHQLKADRFPTEKNHRFEVGIRLLRAGQVDEAIRELQIVRSDPRLQGRALMYLGYCFKARNNWRLAQRNFEEALQHLPKTEENLRKEILFQLASGLAEAGDLLRAVDVAYELANLDFAYRDIGRLLDEWQAKLQKA
jgi:tetratricopeptide (TPR) repeat protein